MFNKILVGVDDGEGARDAIVLARLLLADGGWLTLGHIYHGTSGIWRGPCPPLEPAEREQIRRLLVQAAREAGVDAALRWHGASTVGRGLHELAETVGADLLVVGSSRRSVIGRVFLGDDARASLNGAPCAFALAPAGYAARPGLLREIGVAYNESPESEHALAVARSLAASQGAKLSAFQAVSIPAFALGAGVPLNDLLTSLVEDTRERLATLHDVEAHAAYGSAAEELALYSASLDLLVTGSRSYGPIGRLVHGSTSGELTRMARCPLLVLTRAARAAEAPNSDRRAATLARS